MILRGSRRKEKSSISLQPVEMFSFYIADIYMEQQRRNIEKR